MLHPKTEKVLVQLISMGRSIWLIWVKDVQKRIRHFSCLFPHPAAEVSSR